MYAEVGDRLVTEGFKAGHGDRIGRVLEVRNNDGTPPYLVRWDGDRHESLAYPGPDTFVMRGDNIEV